jgi:DNA end-binding protein Ku
MSTTLDKLDLTDRYHDALSAIIEAKVAGREIVKVEEEEKPVVDIMTALKQSIEQAKSQRKPMEKAKGKAKGKANKKAVVSKDTKTRSKTAG